MSNYSKQHYSSVKNHINEYYSPKVSKQYYFPLVIDDLDNQLLNCTGNGSNFALLHMCHKDFYSNVPSIQICTRCDGTKSYDELIATLAHEFGHYLSWQNSTDQHGPNDPYDIYFSGKPFSLKTSKFVLSEEKLAWKLGFEFLDDLDIDLSHEMIAIKKYALNAYNKFSKKQTDKYYYKNNKCSK